MKNCLTENELAQYAEFLLSYENSEISEPLEIHVQDCRDCKIEVMEVADIVIILEEN